MRVNVSRRAFGIATGVKPQNSGPDVIYRSQRLVSRYPIFNSSLKMYEAYKEFSKMTSLEFRINLTCRKKALMTAEFPGCAPRCRPDSAGQF